MGTTHHARELGRRRDQVRLRVLEAGRVTFFGAELYCPTVFSIELLPRSLMLVARSKPVPFQLKFLLREIGLEEKLGRAFHPASCFTNR
jgi:hypothetical protein